MVKYYEYDQTILFEIIRLRSTVPTPAIALTIVMLLAAGIYFTNSAEQQTEVK